MPKYRVADYRITSFDSGVKGVDPITGEAEGTDVPQNKEKQVLEAAKSAATELVKVEETQSNE